jgi:5-methylcytosine-specific restriction protein A
MWVPGGHSHTQKQQPTTHTGGKQTMTFTPCIVCGEPSPRTRCNQHDLSNPTYNPNRATPRERGYDTTAWRKLSKKAREAQPWCSECGTTQDLTTDHLRWPARTLRDVQVLCRTHNSAKGAAEGRTQGGRGTQTTFPTLRRGAISNSLENGSQEGGGVSG